MFGFNDIDYLGDWMAKDKEVSLNEILDTCRVVVDAPLEFDFNIEDIYAEAEKRGFKK